MVHLLEGPLVENGIFWGLEIIFKALQKRKILWLKLSLRRSTTVSPGEKLKKTKANMQCVHISIPVLIDRKKNCSFFVFINDFTLTISPIMAVQVVSTTVFNWVTYRTTVAHL